MPTRARRRAGVHSVGLAENHAASAVLQHAGHFNFHFLPDHVTAMFTDNHRAVIEIANSLAVRFAFLDEVNSHVLAGNVFRLEGIRDIVEVNDVDLLHAGDFIQIHIVGDDAAADELGYFDQQLIVRGGLRSGPF